MIVIQNTRDFEGLQADGILGMSPTHHDEKGELLIEELYNQGEIDARIFSMQIGDLNEESVITLGGYDLERYAKGDFTWHDLANKNYWTLNMDSVTLGGEELDIETTDVIVDSGTSFLLMPTRKITLTSYPVY